jgi:membrane protein DedA with SNARE-associated domain
METIIIDIASFVTGIISEIGYLGVALFMAIESSFIPFPSEIIVPPAAYLAQEGKFNLWLVVLAGTVGSLVGALINYFLALFLGRKMVYSLSETRLARLFLIDSQKINRAEEHFLNYGNVSTFLGRLVPAIRQLISIPAGFSKMPLPQFVFYTTLGAGSWVVVLALLGYFFGANQEKFEEYYSLISWAVVGLVILVFLFFVFKRKR